MQKIIIASKNPVKIQAALDGFIRMFSDQAFEGEGVSVASGVSDQPQSSEETLRGARQRVKNASTQYPHADFWVGIEGGIEETCNGMEAFAWIVVRSRDGYDGIGKTGSFFLPQKIVDLIKQGKELGEADDIVFGRTNSKQENGAVGLLTDNIIHRKDYYTAAIILALIPFKNTHLYFI